MREKNSAGEASHILDNVFVVGAERQSKKIANKRKLKLYAGVRLRRLLPAFTTLERDLDDEQESSTLGKRRLGIRCSAFLGEKSACSSHEGRKDCARLCRITWQRVFGTRWIRYG